MILIFIIIIILLYLILKNKNKETFKQILKIQDIPIYIINLEHRYDRRQRIEGMLKNLNLNYEITKAVNGKDLSIEQLKDMNMIKNTPFKKGWYGCALSHMNIWKEMLKLEYQYGLIFEDDVIIKQDFIEKINKVLSKIPEKEMNFDILYISANKWYEDSKKGRYITSEIYEPENPDIISGMQAYIVNKKCINTLLEYCVPLYHAIDRILMDLAKKDNKTNLKIFIVKDNIVDINDFGDSETERIEKFKYNNNELTIVSSHYKENLNWLENIYKTYNINIVVCNKEGADNIPDILKNNICPTTKNCGNESSAYLNYIVNNYNNLSDYTVFIHGHENAWHQKKYLLDIFLKKEYIGYDYYELNGFRSNDWNIQVNNPFFNNLINLWDKYFKTQLNLNSPTKLCGDCCAQFIVSKNNIKSIPLETYKLWLDLTLNPQKEKLNCKEIGYVFEYIWHVIFTKKYCI